jgi:hypothetical protein
LSGYDALDVEVQIAERAYEQALSLEQQAMSAAAQQQVYLNTFVQPSLPEASLYPQRWRMVLEVLVGSCVLWALASLVYYGAREHLDELPGCGCPLALRSILPHEASRGCPGFHPACALDRGRVLLHA